MKRAGEVLALPMPTYMVLQSHKKLTYLQIFLWNRELKAFIPCHYNVMPRFRWYLLNTFPKEALCIRHFKDEEAPFYYVFSVNPWDWELFMREENKSENRKNIII